MRLSDGLNAFRLTFDDALLGEVRRDYQQHLASYLNHPAQRPLFEGGDLISMPGPGDSDDYYIKSFREYPLLWISGNNARTHGMFERLFESLDIASDVEERVDFERRIVVNSGFLVVGDRAPEPRWHVDYYPFEKFEEQVVELDALVKDQGLLIIHNTQYRLSDTRVASRYVPLEDTTYPRELGGVFDRNSQRLDLPDGIPSIYRKV